jgi:hypothetical protein
MIASLHGSGIKPVRKLDQKDTPSPSSPPARKDITAEQLQDIYNRIEVMIRESGLEAGQAQVS